MSGIDAAPRVGRPAGDVVCVGAPGVAGGEAGGGRDGGGHLHVAAAVPSVSPGVSVAGGNGGGGPEKNEILRKAKEECMFCTSEENEKQFA